MPVSPIAEWLASLGVPEYSERFAKERIEIDVLSELTDQDLERLGIPLGHRRRMLKAIRERGGSASAAPQVATAAPATPQDSAERRQLTVMFCDLVGSTALSGRLDPEDLRSIIGSYHRWCTELIERGGGFVAKYMGDGVLAYFGYPQAHEHDAERAVQAGLAVVEAVSKLDTGAGVALQVRIGIATGLVVVGDLIGAGAAQEQAVVGETPNLAARLQTLAEPSSVVIASSTRALIGGLFEYRDLGTVALKGFAEDVRAWQVLGTGAVESRFEALRTATTPLVGRDEEVDLLLRRWEQAKRGDGCVVLISGEPGIGKSRIAQTIVERLSGEPHTRLRYFCSPHHQDSALYPSITQLERAAGFRREDTAEQRLAKLEAVLALGTNDLREAVPLLADLLSIPTGDRYPPLNLTPRKRKERTLHAQVAQIEGLAVRQPLLMVWEDVHWSDPTTRESLDLLIDRVLTLQVLVILTFRPEFTPPWIGRPHVTMLTLNRLPRRQGAEMIAYVTGGKLPKEISDQIVDRADGVPLFIEELTKTVLESGIVTEAGDHYVVGGPTAPVAIPTSLHASLLARLDRLAPTREVAQIGAVLGRSFSYELISVVAGMPGQKLDEALSQLASAELVFRRGTPPDAEYTFKHALVQDAAYSTLLRSRRQQLHARIAATLEDRFPEIVAAQPALIAHHCEEAGLTEPAVAYWLAAGRQAWARSAVVEVVALLRRGLALIPALPDTDRRRETELDLQIALGQALITGRMRGAPGLAEVYSRAHELALAMNRPRELASILWGQCLNDFAQGDLPRAQRLAAGLRDLGEANADGPTQVLGWNAGGFAYVLVGAFTTGRAYLEKSLALYDPADRASYAELLPNDERVVLLGHLSMVLAFLGHLDQASRQGEAALEEARRLSHAPTLAIALTHAWLTGWLVRLEPRSLLRVADEHLALAIEHGLEHFRMWALIQRGWCLAGLGRADDGIPLVAAGLRDLGYISFRPCSLTLLAHACRMAGRWRAALTHLAEARGLAEEREVGWWQAETLRLTGDVLLATSDAAAAEASYCAAMALAQEQSAKLWELGAAMSLARLWRDQGKRTEARDLLAPIYGWFTEGFDTPVLKEAKALLDALSS
jgi:class 3 adenylate cyclase/tetratricopeptide (TPR) repeat protein